jgi:hypothetical protein
MHYGLQFWAPDDGVWQRGGAAKPARKRRARKPTLASVAKQASKAGIEVARYEVEPGKIVVVPGKPGLDNAADINPWDVAAAELRKKLQ